MPTWTSWLWLSLGGVLLAPACLIDTVDDCYDDGNCLATGGADPVGGGGSTTSDGGGGSTTSDGGGGMTGCTGDAECTTANAAHCADNGLCVPCTDDQHCAGVDGRAYCDQGVCFACDADGGCDAPQTCDLLDHECVDIAVDALDLCMACSNDDQCSGGRCVPLDFEGSFHGHYCLEEFDGACDKPYTGPREKVSLNDVATASFCGIDEAVVTCEAVLAIGLSCPSGTDGMCIPEGGIQEEPVPGARCETVNNTANLCTYPCGTSLQCPGMAPGNSCGGGPPTYCGG